MVPRQSMGLCSAQEHAFRLNRRRKRRLYHLPRHKFPKRGSSQPVHGAEDSLLLSYTARSYRYAAVHRHSCCCESDGAISSHSRHAAEHPRLIVTPRKISISIHSRHAAEHSNISQILHYILHIFTKSTPPILTSPLHPLQQINSHPHFVHYPGANLPANSCSLGIRTGILPASP